MRFSDYGNRVAFAALDGGEIGIVSLTSSCP